MSEIITVRFPEKNSKNDLVRIETDEYQDNDVHVFGPDEEQQLLTGLVDLESAGLDGFSHFVFKKSWTGLGVEESIPEAIKRSGFYHQYHVLTPDELADVNSVPPYKDFIDRNRESVIVIDPKTGIDAENSARLEKAVQNRVGIILGGGAGNPNDKFYSQFTRFLEKPIAAGTPFGGVCMGHEIIGTIMHNQEKVGEGVTNGYYEIGSTMEDVTNFGKIHPIFRRLGRKVNVVHVNQLHWDLEAADKYGNVLTTNPDGTPSALSVNMDYPGQAITWQAHPEFSMRGSNTDSLSKNTPLGFEASDGKSEVVLPKNITHAYAGLVRYMAQSLPALERDFDIKAGDLKQMVNQKRLATHLGKDFYGPLLTYMTYLRFSNR